MANHYRKGFVIIGAIALIAGAVSHSYARVSWSWGAARDSDRALISAGGTSIYAADLSVNGAEAELSVFSFGTSASSLSRKIQRIFHKSKIAYKGGRMALATVVDGDTVLRIIVLQVSEGTKTLLIKIAQTEDDYNRSLTEPSKHLMTQVPEYPGSSPSFYAHNRDTDFQIATARSKAAPSDIHNYYDAMLSSQGWTKPLEDSSSLHFYIKGDSICVVQAMTAERSSNTTITLLHKRHGVK